MVSQKQDVTPKINSVLCGVSFNPFGEFNFIFRNGANFECSEQPFLCDWKSTEVITKEEVTAIDLFTVNS